jgi:hypothetical protein
MANRTQMIRRRQFLRGVGGVTLGLPLLEAFVPRGAKAQTAAARPPFTIIVVHGNGVVQAGAAFVGTDPETFWPTNTGALTKAAMDADAATRTTGLLSTYADRLLMVRGVAHPFVDTGCMHASGDLQLLTATKPSGDGNKAIATGESVDTRLARELNPEGREPLVLHAGKYSPGGAGFDIPGYVSYLGPKQPRTYVDSPYKAYQRIIGVVGGGAAMTPADMQAQQQLATSAKSVNDLLRRQIQELLARKDLSGSDVKRLNQHFAAIRDIEIKTGPSTTSGLPAADIAAMQQLDPAPYDLASHEKMIELQMEVMAFAIASDYTRVAVLKVGDREDDSTFTIGGTKFVYHTASHRSIANGVELCRQVDVLHAGYFKGLLDRLAAFTTPTGPLIDNGLTILTNQVANGKHSFEKVPWIFSVGKNTSYLKRGQFLDVKATTNQMLNTLLNAGGVRKAGGAPVDDFGDVSLTKGVITGIVA